MKNAMLARERLHSGLPDGKPVYLSVFIYRC